MRAPQIHCLALPLTLKAESGDHVVAVDHHVADRKIPLRQGRHARRHQFGIRFVSAIVARYGVVAGDVPDDVRSYRLGFLRLASIHTPDGFDVALILFSHDFTPLIIFLRKNYTNREDFFIHESHESARIQLYACSRLPSHSATLRGL